MPAKGASKQCDRECLVCCETTRIAHLGIELCRACAVFFRRAKPGNEFVCRSGTGNCATGRSLNCKRCRFDHIAGLLERSPRAPKCSSSPDDAHDLDRRPALSLLDSVAVHYKAMSFARLSAELHARPDPPHPMHIGLDKGPYFEADFASLTGSIRIFMTATLEFARAAFPEFASLGDAEQWSMAIHFFYVFRMFEASFRSGKAFPDEPNRYFVAFSLYFEGEPSPAFFATAPKEGNAAGALEYMRSGELPKQLRAAKEAIARVDMSAEEFLGVAIMMFWSIPDDRPVSDELRQAAERYREATLKELHVFYREEMHLEDYAARLGELMMFLQVFERTKDLKEHFEVLRLFDILREDSFIYQLKRD